MFLCVKTIAFVGVLLPLVTFGARAAEHYALPVYFRNEQKIVAKISHMKIVAPGYSNRERGITKLRENTETLKSIFFTGRPAVFSFHVQCRDAQGKEVQLDLSYTINGSEDCLVVFLPRLNPWSSELVSIFPIYPNPVASPPVAAMSDYRGAVHGARRLSPLPTTEEDLAEQITALTLYDGSRACDSDWCRVEQSMPKTLLLMDQVAQPVGQFFVDDQGVCHETLEIEPLALGAGALGSSEESGDTVFVAASDAVPSVPQPDAKPWYYFGFGLWR